MAICWLWSFNLVNKEGYVAIHDGSRISKTGGGCRHVNLLFGQFSPKTMKMKIFGLRGGLSDMQWIQYWFACFFRIITTVQTKKIFSNAKSKGKVSQTLSHWFTCLIHAQASLLHAIKWVNQWDRVCVWTVLKKFNSCLFAIHQVNCLWLWINKTLKSF